MSESFRVLLNTIAISGLIAGVIGLIVGAIVPGINPLLSGVSLSCGTDIGILAGHIVTK